MHVLHKLSYKEMCCSHMYELMYTYMQVYTHTHTHTNIKVNQLCTCTNIVPDTLYMYSTCSGSGTCN